MKRAFRRSLLLRAEKEDVNNMHWGTASQQNSEVEEPFSPRERETPRGGGPQEPGDLALNEKFLGI